MERKGVGVMEEEREEWIEERRKGCKVLVTCEWKIEERECDE